MAYTYKPIVGARLTTAAVIYYLAGGVVGQPGVTSRCETVAFMNDTATDRTVTVHFVPNGGTASSSNMVISARTVKAGETLTFSECIGLTLAPGGTLQCLASANSAITINGTFLDIT